MPFVFSPNELHRLNRLAFRMRCNPTESSSGERRIRRSGDGFDFLDYRAYSRGDDIRKIDWNLYGRFRQLFVRIHEAPRQTSISFVIDASRSMMFGEPRDKITQAQLISAGLTFVALRGGDRVYLTTFGESSLPIRGPFSGIRRHSLIIDELQQITCGGQSLMLQAVRQLASRRLHRGLVVLISDFLGTGDIEAVLRIICGSGGRALAIQLLAPEDRGANLKPGVVRLQDSETGEMVQVLIDESSIAAFQEQFRTRQEAMKRLFSQRGQTLVETMVHEDYPSAISRVLSTGVIRS